MSAVMGETQNGWFCCHRLLRDALKQVPQGSPLGTAVYQNFINRGYQNEVMDEGFEHLYHHDPWAVVEVVKDTDVSGGPNKNTQFFYFLAISTAPNAYFSYDDQTWFKLPPNWIKNKIGCHHKYSVQVLCPNHNINHRIEVWLGPHYGHL
jgi:hypothetical protein